MVNTPTSPPVLPVERVASNAPWPIVPLGELAANKRNAITDGPFGSKLKTDHYTELGPRVIRLKNIGDTEFVNAKAHIAEQTRIVAEVERRLSVVEELETVVDANLQRATRLRQSGLRRAFSGQSTKTS